MDITQDSSLSSPVLLLLDSSTSACSVALSAGEHIIEHLCQTTAQGQHSSLLAPMVDQLLSKARSLSLRLDAVVVSAGPGSYTGLRIASSLGKGICFGLDIPLVAVSTLEMMASGYGAQLPERGSSERPRRLVPMLDARRMEVYTALFDEGGGRLSEDVALVLSGEEWPFDGMQSFDYHFVGDGSGKVDGLWPGSYCIASEFVPEARYMLPLALRAYRNNDFVDLAYWTPHYLKEYVAVVGKNKVLG